MLSKKLKEFVPAALVLLISTLCSFSSQATLNKLLIINSYNQNAPWSSSIATPLNMHIIRNDTVYGEMVNLNASFITDSTRYYQMVDDIMNIHQQEPPKYIVMIGSLAFTMRERIRNEWGDVPIVLISRTNRYAPLYYYFAGYGNNDNWDEMPRLEELRKLYNFTLVEVPDLYKSTIDVMSDLMPDMENFVFLADGVYLNRWLNSMIKNYLADKFPNIKYNWLQATDSTSVDFQEIMMTPHRKTGYLLSTWFYEKFSDISNNSMVIENADLHLLPGSMNPIFSLRDSYMSIGSVGGVYNNPEEVKNHMLAAVDSMIAGVNMRTIPFSTSISPEVCLNYPQLTTYGIDPKRAPKGTVFTHEPPSFWQRYFGTILFVGAILFLLIFLAVVMFRYQRRRISYLESHREFISLMPIPFAKATVLFDEKNTPIRMGYSEDQMNPEYVQLLDNNAIPGTRCLFPEKFIIELISQTNMLGKPLRFKYRFNATDTYYEFTLCVTHTQPLPDGKTEADVFIFANDITALSKSDHDLKRTTEKLELTLKVAQIIPWTWNVEADELSYDIQRYLSIINVPTEKYAPLITVSSTDFLSHIHPDDQKRIVSQFQAMKEGRIREFHGEFRLFSTRSGVKRCEWLNVNCATVSFSEDGRPKLIIGASLVVTKRKEEELQLVEAQEKAKQSDEMKSKFLANMSHEIRTPLNAIVGFSSLIAKTHDEEKKETYCNIIETNNELLLHLINDLLDMAKIESNTIVINKSMVDINHLLESVKSTVQFRVPKHIMFNMVLGSHECKTYTDVNRVSQVLINFLTNACKFTTQGSITLGYELLDDEIYFYVKDTGMGVALEQQDKLFHRFSKLTKDIQGNGLGLSISKHFIELLGGQVGLKSRGLGKGSTFWFTLPYIPNDPEEEGKEGEDKGKANCTSEAEKTSHEGALAAADIIKAESEKAPEDKKDIDRKDITVLVAEDNDSNYLLFESILEDDYHLIHAHDGAEAIAYFKEYNPHIIIMDINMPNVDGFEATARIREISGEVPIIAVTAYAFAADKKKIMQSGFNDYVPKPIKEKDLLDSIERALNRLFVIS